MMEIRNKKELLELDKNARERIEKDINTNFFVEAGAGSGKTTALVSRMTALVISGVSVEKICAITFTKAAANEFHDRFRRKLSECSHDMKLTEEERSRCSYALQRIDLCFTGTIDSFCNMLLREHPLEAAVPPDASVCSGREMNKQYTAEYRRAAKGEYGEVMQRKYYRFCGANSNPYEVFCSSAAVFTETRNAVLLFEHPDENAFDDDGEDKKKFVEMLRYICEHPEIWKSSKSEKVKKERQEAAESIRDNLRLLDGSWREHISEVLSFFKYTIKGSNKDTALPLCNDPGDSFLDSFGEYVVPVGKNGKINSYIIDLNSERSPVRMLKELQHSITLDFMSYFAREAADTLRRSGRLSYFDCLLYLRDMLKRDAESGGRLIRHINDRHSYYLIDEFQDTNPMQAEIFFYLTAIEPQSDWRACVPRPGSLFIVGDPKQSIYRFRNADVASYLRVREMFCGEIGEAINLTRNFRSTRELCGWFDSTFTRLMDTSSDTQCQYNPIPVDESKTEELGSLHGIYSYDVGQLSDPDYLADMIKWLVGSDEHTVRDGNGKVRRVRFSDIMVITPKTTHLAEYISRFKESGIPAFVEGKTLFESCRVLREASKVINAVAFPKDNTKAYQALKSRAFSISEDALCKWRANGGKISVFYSSEDEALANDPVNIALSTLGRLVSESRKTTVSAALMNIIDDLKLFEKCGSENLEYLHYAVELLRTAEITGEAASLQNGADFLEGLLDGKLSGEKIDRCMSLARENDRVHIANMHKVKGLEAPIVILADPVRPDGDADKRINYSGTKPFCCIFRLNGPRTAKGTKKYTESIGFAGEQEAEKIAVAEEVTRLRYVAATRARDMLIIADRKKNGISDETENIWYQLLDPDMPAINIDSLPEENEQTMQSVLNVSADEIYVSAEENGVFAERAVEEKTYTILRPSQMKIKGKSSACDEPQEREEKEHTENLHADRPHLNAALVGSMIHRLMEMLVSARGMIDIDMLSESIRQEFYDLAAGNHRALCEILKHAAEKMTNGGYPQTNGVPDDLLGELSGAETVLCEVPFCLNSKIDGNTAISNGIMDLVYCKGGQWHIIDYKTSEDDGDLDKRYAAQLESYREAFFALTGETADARVYHIDASY